MHVMPISMHSSIHSTQQPSPRIEAWQKIITKGCLAASKDPPPQKSRDSSIRDLLGATDIIIILEFDDIGLGVPWVK